LYALCMLFVCEMYNQLKFNTMKKTLLTLFVILAGIVTATAKPDVSLIKGSLLELKGSNAKIFVRWDYTKSTIEDKPVAAYLKERGADWERDYPAELTRAEKAFRERLGDKSKDVSTVTKESEADYVIVMKVKDFNYGQTALAVTVGFGAGDARLSGTMEIYKKGQKEPIAVLDVDGVHGKGYGSELRRENTYRDLAENLAKLIKKAK